MLPLVVLNLSTIVLWPSRESGLLFAIHKQWTTCFAIMRVQRLIDVR